MDAKWFSPAGIFLLMFLYILMCRNYVHGQNNIFRVTDFGAVSDGVTDNSQAFLNTWKKACQTNGGTLTIPEGNYYIKGASFDGPCNGKTTFNIAGTLKASSDPALSTDYWILFNKVNNLILTGTGTFDGNGASAWGRSKIRPTSIKFNVVTSSLIQNIRSLNSKMFHISLYACRQVTIDNVGLTAPGDSPNTDGIHISRSDNIKITNAHIATGDDCVSLGDGCTNINITGVACGPGHGISIGSLGRYPSEMDVSGITVTGCNFTNTLNGLRIKTFAPSSTSNLVSNVTFAHIRISNAYNPIIIDQFYCPQGNCTRTGAESSIQIKGVKFIDVTGSSGQQVGVKILCSKTKPCQDIEFSGLNLNFKGKPATATCSNADERFIGPNQVPSLCS